ncbi:serine-threonine protein kinase 19-domain-containing protein [Dactylonectria estremocensis]|uniref:Serine-threonine protein kinase 19-domain-containing protein n=1 Tax=Dactylonectria estremocensis TaxID=1079267 RepID=A0A9P9JF26_9HYPO|nr:serine-threonine protein kinase 19-domain-containing protein [Dactylonectria estremocensis]
MPKSIRSILGKSSRVTKPSRPTPMRQTRPGASPPKARKSKEEEAELFQDKLDDLGLTKILEDELTLRDVIQAMRYIRSRIFSPVPATGFNSTRTAELLNYRVAAAPIVTVGHLNAVLNSPSKVSREMAELIGKGVVRRMRVERRGGMGEALIEVADLDGMLDKARLGEETKKNLMAFLRENPTAQTLPKGVLESSQADELVRAGFLTASTPSTLGNTLDVRPEDRTTMMSIQHVARFASGSVSAVGGCNAVHLAGGGGGAPTLTHAASLDASPAAFRLAIPGHGRHLKLAGAAVDWVREALGRTKWGEGPESWLQERFEGGGLYGPRWKEFWGVEWEWVLGEAVGLGVVEVFETGSVGRGVRALGL